MIRLIFEKSGQGLRLEKQSDHIWRSLVRVCVLEF